MVSTVLDSHKTTCTFLNIFRSLEFFAIIYDIFSYEQNKAMTADLTIYDFLLSFHLLDNNAPFKVKHGSFYRNK